MLYYKFFCCFKTVGAIKDMSRKLNYFFSNKHFFPGKLIVDDVTQTRVAVHGAHNFKLKYLKF